MINIVQILRILILIPIVINLSSCNPKTSEHYSKSGFRQLKKREKWNLSFQSFCKAVELDSNNYEAYYGFGIYYLQQNDSVAYELSRMNFLKAISLKPNRSESYALIAQTYIDQSRMSRDTIDVDLLLKAIPYLNKAILLDNQNSWYYYSRYYCKSYAGDDIGARIDLVKSCECGNYIACWMLEVDANR